MYRRRASYIVYETLTEKSKVRSKNWRVKLMLNRDVELKSLKVFANMKEESRSSSTRYNHDSLIIKIKDIVYCSGVFDRTFPTLVNSTD